MLIISMIVFPILLILADRGLKIEYCLQYQGLSDQTINSLFEKDMRGEIKLNTQDINCLVAIR